jgi:hypothetical protein
MKRRQLTAAITCLCLSIGCQVRAPQPSEAPLFGNLSSVRIWVIDAVTEFPDGNDQHLSALITQDQSVRPSTISCYLSVWQTTAPHFRYAIQSAPGRAGGHRNRWPIQMRMAADSSQAAFSWDWSRSSLWLQGALIGPERAQGAQTWFLKGGYPIQRAFIPVEVCRNPSILSVSPWQGQSKASDFQRPGTTHWRISIFDQPDALFGARPGECAAWMSLGFSDGRSMQAFLQVDALRLAKPLALQRWAAQAPLAANKSHAPVHVPEAAVWKSPIAGHDYPLEWALDADFQFCSAASSDAVFFVRPRQADQELPMKRSSFWMGAIEARAGNNGTIVGKGNLFVLAR